MHCSEGLDGPDPQPAKGVEPDDRVVCPGLQCAVADRGRLAGGRISTQRELTGVRRFCDGDVQRERSRGSRDAAATSQGNDALGPGGKRGVARVPVSMSRQGTSVKKEVVTASY